MGYPYLIGLHYKGAYMGYPYLYFCLSAFLGPLYRPSTCRLGVLVAEWMHFTLLGIVLPTIKLKVYTFGGLKA